MAAALVASCRVASADRYADLLESIEVPSGWELAHERVREPFGANPCGPGSRDCPAAHHYYHVGGQPADAYPAARQLLVDAGFEIADEDLPCGDPRHGPAACRLEATRGPDIVTAHLYEPGLDFDGLGIAREGFSIVELRAYDNPDAEGEP